MCNPADIQHKIHSFTKDGEHIARFLTETMRGKTPGVKVCHRMEAAKHLIRYGFPDTECETTSDRLSRAGGNPKGQGEDETPVQSPLSLGERARVRGAETAKPISHLDILNYQIAHLIRHETAEGHTIVNFLVHIMTGKDRPFTPRKFRIKPADRMAAARELLRRGFGDLGSRRKQSDSTDEANAYDTLHTDLAKRMREYSERGTDTIRFLLELMSDPDPDKEFTVHHRMYAAQELLRRGWDTNYDAIKPEHLQAYWQDKESPRLSIGQKKTQARLSTTIDDYDKYDDTDYEAIAKEIREEEDRQAAAAQKSLPLRRGKVGACPELAEGMGVTEPASKGMPRSESGSTATSKLPLPQGEGWGEGTAGILNKPLPPRRGKARACPELAEGMGVTEPVSNDMPRSESGSTATSKLPLPQGEGWGEGTAGILNKPLPPRRRKARARPEIAEGMGVKNPAQSPLPNKAATINEHDKAIIKEFKEAMDKGDERAALRAQAKYRRIDVKPEKNIYDYGPNDPDPTIDYYFEPLNPEEQAKFDEKERREHGLTEDEAATNGTATQPSSNGTADSLAPIKQAAALHNTPILPNPLAAKRKNPTIRSP